MLFYIAGIACITVQNIDPKAAAISAGIILIVYGVIKIVGYLSKDLYCLAFQYDFACGLLLIVFGILVFVTHTMLDNYLLTAIGAFILLDSLLCIQTTIDAKKFGLSSWPLILALSSLAGALGIVLILVNTKTVAGFALLAEGIMRQYIVQCTVRLTP